MIQLKFRQFQTDSGDDSAMIQKGIFHEGAVNKHTQSQVFRLEFDNLFIITVHNHIGLYLRKPDSICVFRTLSVLASDSICGKWTQRRGGVNKKGKNHVNYLKFSKASLFMGLLKLYSSSLCWYLARTLFQFFITRWIAD